MHRASSAGSHQIGALGSWGLVCLCLLGRLRLLGHCGHFSLYLGHSVLISICHVLHLHKCSLSCNLSLDQLCAGLVWSQQCLHQLDHRTMGGATAMIATHYFGVWLCRLHDQNSPFVAVPDRVSCQPRLGLSTSPQWSWQYHPLRCQGSQLQSGN